MTSAPPFRKPSAILCADWGKEFSKRAVSVADVDAPLGVPESYLAALSRVSSQPSSTFLDLLDRARTMPRFFDGTSDAKDWRPERPFFSVPAGEGGLGSYVDVAARHGVNMYRRIDRITGIS